ncbi:2-oxoglutarate dehydrogenase E2 component (dihydrolipoamide succinyltransferase) [Dyadobacter sp. BE34]|uniref:Dihydrolipoyllysine-residue succinyltransferase component of 2-oxoglutarate dehydrogenase complex n=1 Tax=Dyadobacter fermentans TaxID=94254 RepID=A0ABU1R835_9BACT|nr:MULTISPECIES: 2-oxoglutarate dehydrogenase complex dihydrolipoyllysine-residue succinyltransferase [Dyadobacter]MDR6809105.1 2-oxoglutarate dehydrogenase E2 component (dihydrolipoamide succinyltransferase) [Dyadobacter fermentans]MDR7046848.1 2-oxoglutarate dehydrogenase E2 component (dihydrolipoamide succinyltransferase) [Dyadobacter sp. BE242]MDR7201162.1 2-oxoglutarate dehydrogenase E2 component (dihydrolipoamide succinyltransferase) [Dyadobacter sp. BE34]MDR7219122.1 2-oxoglutarate dehyd
MAEIEIKVPPVGESITEVTIGNWFKNDGDFVKMDEVICGLDSDKATFELTAEAEGILHIKAQEGDTLNIGELIATIEAANGAAPKETASKAEAAAPAAPVAAEPAKAEAPAAAAPAATGQVYEMKVPAVGESISEVTIASWSKKDGDYVAVDEILCELESDKATFELPAEAAGILTIVGKEGDTLAIGAVICTIAVTTGSPAAGSPVAAPAQASAPAASADKAYSEKHASPVAAKILAEKGIDPKDVNGSGSGGKIMKDDALKAEKAAPAAAPAAAKPAAPAPAAAPAVAGARASRREKMSSLRKTIARRLVAVKNETAMLTTFNEVDMKPVMDLRAKFKDKFKEKHEVGLGFMSFFVKAVTVALKDFPVINAQIDGEELVYNDFADISVAVSTPRGLVVPVIRNAETLSFAAIEKEIVRLAVRARDGKLGLDEMSGGTFTITNGGTFGSMLSTPIINAPQSAILGMHNIVERPVVVDGQIVVRPIMYVALSYDHRTIDGKDSVSFLVRVKQLLEDPMRLLLDM